MLCAILAAIGIPLLYIGLRLIVPKKRRAWGSDLENSRELVVKEETNIPDKFVLLVSAMKDDKTLKKWFMSLKKMPDNLRLSELGQMSARMREDGVDEKLIRIVESLMDENIYVAIEKSIGAERGEVKDN
jgi:hypothetical protein